MQFSGGCIVESNSESNNCLTFFLRFSSVFILINALKGLSDDIDSSNNAISKKFLHAITFIADDEHD